MGGQHDLYRLVDIGPFRMVVQLFGLDRNLCHPSKSLREIPEHEGLGNGVPPVLQGPSGPCQSLKRRVACGPLQFVCHYSCSSTCAFRKGPYPVRTSISSSMASRSASR